MERDSRGHDEHAQLKSLIIICTMVIVLVQIAIGAVGSPLNAGIAHSVDQKLLEREYDRVGGQENYETLYELQVEQAKAYIEQLGGDGTTPTAPSATTEENTGEIAQADIDSILSLHSKYDTDTDFLIFEFSNTGCGFCQRHHADETLSKVREEADVSVNVVVGFNDGYEPDKSRAMACIGELGGTEKFYVAEDHFLRKGELSAVYDLVGISEADVTACVDEQGYKEKFDTVNSVTSKYGLGGTPNHLVINLETRKYVRIPGAYPKETFLEAIEELKE